MVMCEPTSLLITRCVSRVLRMLFLKSSQFIPCPETAFSSSSILGSLFSVRMASSFLMSSGSTLTPMSLARFVVLRAGDDFIVDARDDLLDGFSAIRVSRFGSGGFRGLFGFRVGRGH